MVLFAMPIVRCVTPSLHEPDEAVHGLYIMDSFGWIYSHSGWTLLYMQMLVDNFYRRGLVVVVLVMDGARVTHGDYMEMILGSGDVLILENLLFAVIVSMGNDLLSAWSPVSFRLDHDHVLSIGRGVLDLREYICGQWPRCRVALVDGGSAASWGYVTDAELYDQAVSRCVYGGASL